MSVIKLAGVIFATTVVSSGSAGAQVQVYPNKPVRIVTAAPGASMDLVARVTAHGLSTLWTQPVVVENRAGGGGVIAADTVAKASPDGYTLLTYTAAVVILPFLKKGVPFDPVKDFAPVSLATSSPNVLVVHPSLTANSVQELIGLARAQRGKLNYSSSGTGSGMHLSVELLKSMAEVDIVHIGYKSTAQALNDTVSGRVHLAIPSASTVMPHVRAGRLKALAVTSGRPSPLAPGLPTVAASGVPGYESELIVGIWVPAKTPRALIDKLNRDIARVLNQPDSKERLITGAEVIASSPQHFANVIDRERTKLGKVIKDAGIRDE